MSLDDTIELENPIACPVCGTEQTEVRVEELGRNFTRYRIGTLLEECPVITGILKGTYWCAPCNYIKRPLYIAIWQTILITVELDQTIAEAKLASVDRLTLIDFLRKSQARETEIRNGYNRFYDELRGWHQHINTPAAGSNTPRSQRMRGLNLVPDEILDASDPVGEILERHKIPRHDPSY